MLGITGALDIAANSNTTKRRVRDYICWGFISNLKSLMDRTLKRSIRFWGF